MLAFVRYRYNKSRSEEYDLHKIWKNIKFANELAGNEYIDFDDLKYRATGNEFLKISDEEEVPFE